MLSCFYLSATRFDFPLIVPISPEVLFLNSSVASTFSDRKREIGSATISRLPKSVSDERKDEREWRQEEEEEEEDGSLLPRQFRGKWVGKYSGAANA